jgi:hypothetical protein
MEILKSKIRIFLDFYYIKMNKQIHYFRKLKKIMCSLYRKKFAAKLFLDNFIIIISDIF